MNWFGMDIFPETESSVWKLLNCWNLLINLSSNSLLISSYCSGRKATQIGVTSGLNLLTD